MHNYAEQTCTMLSTTHDLFALCRFVVELSIFAQFFTLCTTHAQFFFSHNCLKSEKNMHKCTIAQCGALSEYCALHNCALLSRVLSVVHIYVVQHVNCVILHYFEQFVPAQPTVIFFRNCVHCPGQFVHFFQLILSYDTL